MYVGLAAYTGGPQVEIPCCTASHSRVIKPLVFTWYHALKKYGAVEV
jgi:hypothetical protein